VRDVGALRRHLPRCSDSVERKRISHARRAIRGKRQAVKRIQAATGPASAGLLFVRFGLLPFRRYPIADIQTAGYGQQRSSARRLPLRPIAGVDSSRKAARCLSRFNWRVLCRHIVGSNKRIRIAKGIRFLAVPLSRIVGVSTFVGGHPSRPPPNQDRLCDFPWRSMIAAFLDA
jgi:hypothetical protein